MSEAEARRTDIVDLIANIVTAHVSNNATSSEELLTLIKSMFQALTATTSPVAPTARSKPRF